MKTKYRNTVEYFLKKYLSLINDFKSQKISEITYFDYKDQLIEELLENIADEIKVDMSN